MDTEIAREEYLDRLKDFIDRPDLVKIITGVRRSGKSVLLSQLRSSLDDMGKHTVYVNLEEKQYFITSDRDLYAYITEMMLSTEDFILLDEVQFVDGWENTVNALRSAGANIYVTGSNAKVLSSEFSTILAGRYVEIHILPFSFKEFLERYPVKGDVRLEQRFNQYVRYGGMPIIDLNDKPVKNNAIMEGVYDSIVNRDVVQRSNLGMAVVQNLTRFMYSNVGNIITVRSLTEATGVTARTVERYLEALTDSFAFYKVGTYDLVGKKMMKIKAKFYASDPGLRNIALSHEDDDASGLLENIVLLELIRRGYDVVVGSYRDYEVDFTVRFDGKVTFIQIARTVVDESTRKREERPLNLLEKGDKLILTLDRKLPPENNGIRYRNLIDFLLE